MAQVPEHQRARVVHQLRDPRHIGKGAAAVGHVGETDQRDLGIQRRLERFLAQALIHVGVDHPQLAAVLRGDALQHVPVGREVIVVGDDHAPAGLSVQRGAGQLVEIHRGGVADQDLPWCGADQVRTDQVTDLTR